MKPSVPNLPVRTPAKLLTTGTWIVLTVGLAVTTGMYLLVGHYEDERIRRDVARQSDVRHELLRGHLFSYEDALRSLRLLFENSADISAEEFSRAADDLLSRYDSIQALQWIPVVPAEKRAAVEAYGRAHIAPDFAIKERIPGKSPPLFVAGEKPLYLPILYNYPLASNEAATGYDLQTSPTFENIEQARSTGQLVFSHKFELIQKHAGLVMIAAVRGRPSPGDDDILGFVQIVFRLNDMMLTIWEASSEPILDILVMDCDQHGKPINMLFGRTADGRALPDDSGIADFEDALTTSHTITIGSRIWKAYYRPAEHWLKLQNVGTPKLALTAGLLLTLLGGAYVRTLGLRNRHIAEVVDERTTELKNTQVLLEDDIARRRRAETELQEVTRQLRSILGQIPGMVYRYTWDDSVHPLFVSTGCRPLSAYDPEDFTRADFDYLELVHVDDRERYRRAIKLALDNRKSYEIEYRVHDRHGEIKWVLDRGTGVFAEAGELLFIEGLVINIDDRRRAEAEKLLLERKLLEGQKLESLGVLAGGIAHDFNNLLTGILGHANLLRQDISDPGCLPLVDRIERASLRAAELCQQMLAYSGRGKFSVQTVNLDKVTTDLLSLIEASISKNCRLHLDFATPPIPVSVDPTQMRQIIMNLVINASDAIGDHMGDIIIKTGRQSIDSRYLRECVLSPDLPTGDYAFLEVRDSGCGMSAETLAKIFDPFFTTKFTGRGLGLAAVLGIIRGHEGALHVTSQPGFGSAFRMLLPIAGLPLAGMQSNAPFRPAVAPAKAGTRILLVDDDEQVRMVGEQILLTLGHQPTLAPDGETALHRYRAAPQNFDLILLDLTMPGIGGADVLVAVRKINPDQRVLLMSGYSEQDVVRDFRDAPGVGFLQKPFSMSVLRDRIATMMAGTAAGATS